MRNRRQFLEIQACRSNPGTVDRPFCGLVFDWHNIHIAGVATYYSICGQSPEKWGGKQTIAAFKPPLPVEKIYRELLRFRRPSAKILATARCENAIRSLCPH